VGVAYAQLGRAAEATQAYREALRRDPAYYQAVANLAALLESEKRYGEALEELERLTALDPGNPQARFRLAACYLALDRFDEARQLLEQVVKEVPRHLEALRLLARVARKTGRAPGRPKKYYARLVEADPGRDEVHLDLAEAPARVGIWTGRRRSCGPSWSGTPET